MTKGLLVSRARKLFLGKLSISNPSLLNINNYKAYRNLYNKLLKICKKNYLENKLSENQNDPKKTWKILNEALKRKAAAHDKIDIINIDNQEIINPKTIANSFNDFFSSVGINIASKIPNSSSTPESFLLDTPHSLLDLGLVGTQEVEERIKSLQTKQSLDLFDLSTSLLKKLSPAISFPLSHIFNLSLQTGEFPHC